MPADLADVNFWINTVRLAQLFEGLGLPELKRLLKSATVVRKEAGEFYFMQGDICELVYVLVDGKVRLNQVGTDGRQVTQGYIGTGREFGIIAAVSAANYPVSAQSATRSVALGWNKEYFRNLVIENPRIAQNALNIMGRQVAEFQSRVRELATQRVDQRIARALIRLAHQTGRQTEEGVLIDLPLTRRDLAELTGATLFTVSRTLKKWETHGLVLSRREKVIITSMPELSALAGLQEQED